MAEVVQVKQNSKSLMPDGLEEQMTRQEMADLFALLSLEHPPGTPANSIIRGTPGALHPSK
jgi:hypothetical protein